MATSTQPLLIGVDVSKAELVIARNDVPGTTTLANDRRPIRRWLKALPGTAALAVEATNTYHRTLMDEAHRLGHRLYLVNAYQLSRYRDSIGTRAKTDRTDAELLLRYLAREQDQLRPWTPPPQAYTHIQHLLRRRARLAQARITLQQSLTGLAGLQRSVEALLRRIDRLDQRLQQRLQQALREAGWLDEARRCQAIEGIGPLTAAAVTLAFHRGAFAHSDAFIAFLGLDVRVRDSGTYCGRRKLTKQGDPESRRLLHNAAMAARRSPTWAPYYQRYIDRGLKPTQALVILARKLARVAFAILKNQTEYQPGGLKMTCPAT